MLNAAHQPPRPPQSVAADASVTYEDKLNDSGNDSLLLGIIRVSSFTEKTAGAPAASRLRLCLSLNHPLRPDPPPHALMPPLLYPLHRAPQPASATPSSA